LTSAPDAPLVVRRSKAITWQVFGGALLCLLVSSSASAIVPMGFRPKPAAAPAKSTARYVPARPHADPASGETPLVAILVSGRPTGSSGSVCARGPRVALADRPEPTGIRHRARGNTPRGVGTIPSHWGATHLSV
jgi:hypothetical protein